MGQSNRIKGPQIHAAAALPVYDVIAPACGQVMDVIALADQIEAVNCHWLRNPGGKGGRSVACELWRDDCPHCKVKARRLWLGFLQVLQMPNKRKAILRVGPETATVLLARTAKLLGWRGMGFRLGRGEQQTTGALVIEGCPFSAPHPLPWAFSMRHSLCTVLGTDALPDHLTADEEDIPLLEGGVS